MIVVRPSRRDCLVDGRRVRLSPQETILLACLLEDGGTVAIDRLIEQLWPNPETQPLAARGMVTGAVGRLRRLGLAIDTVGHGRRFNGYAIRQERLARLAS